MYGKLKKYLSYTRFRIADELGFLVHNIVYLPNVLTLLNTMIHTAVFGDSYESVVLCTATPVVGPSSYCAVFQNF